ncbi:transposase, partial [Merdimonas faecis]
MKYGIPAIFNCDQGSQYTSKEYITLLQSYGIRISMDGRASWRDNVLVERSWRTLKYECIFLNDWASMPQLEAGLEDFIRIYNEERPHESLGYQTTSVVYCKVCFPLENDK